ncbi:MAG: ABC transporter ATP-binding protein [Ruminococcaceae bacterium]|nr:ABC transporter ATP-binding protein [Oscillospiraceae bacterium]
MIRIDGISKKYKKQTVLDSFSLSVDDGKKIALMGASGSGKTTLLRIISGLEKPDAGSVSYNGDIAVMFQEPRLLPWKTAKDNICAVLKKENSHLAQKYLSLVGLDDAKEKHPHELSGGMAQRVAFARFLAFAEETGADNLLLDEPFSALDSETEEKMLSVLLDFAADKTVILVTHDDDTAQKLGGMVVKM